jgi:hypothetical protein
VSIYQASGFLFILVALLLTVLAAIALYEAWTLITQRAPITWFVRLGIADHPRFAFVIAMVIGLFAGHFFWR